MALLHLLKRCSQESNSLPIAICHVNYGLRDEESDADANFVKDAAAMLEIPFFLRQLSNSEKSHTPTRNIQAWARALRYEFFESLAQEGWCIAIGHTCDDLAENTLLRLSRGSGAGSLAGMKEWNPPYWRPLLAIRKTLLQAWLDGQELPFRQDSSNDKLIYTRNRIRRKVLPELEGMYPGATRRVARCALEAQELTQFVRDTLKQEILQLRTHGLEASRIAGLQSSVIKEVLSCGIGVKKQQGYLGGRLLDQIVDAVKSGKSSYRIDLPDSEVLLIKNKVISIAARNQSADKRV